MFDGAVDVEIGRIEFDLRAISNKLTYFTLNTPFLTFQIYFIYESEINIWFVSWR